MSCKIIFTKRKLNFALFAFILFISTLTSVSAELNYTTGGAIYGVFADGSTTNFLNLTFQFTTCSLSDCSDANFSTVYTNATLSDLSSLNNASYLQYKATFFTENQNYTPYLFNVTIDYTYLDITFPLLDFVSPTPANNSGASGSFTVNVSITEENLKNVTWNWNGDLITFNSTNESLTDLGGGSWLFTYTQTGLVVGQSYTYNVSISDYAGNINSTETRRINGNTAPTFTSVSYTPNSTDDLDPSTNIRVVVNISDSDDNFDTAILQWKNSTGGYGENNITMANTTAKSSYTILNATLPLPSYESNITFRILANDTAGDSSYSNNYTLESFWDCTWTATSDLSSTAGWDINKEIGNITINNTGDSEHSTGCSLDFRLTYDLTEGRIYFDNDYVKPSDTYTISANSSQNIAINATFLTETKEENVIISTNEFRGRSETGQRNTTATLVSNQAGPYLYQTITSNPSSVYLTSGNLSLNAYLRNIMGSSDVNENNTAYNVSFYWTLPSGLTNSSGNLSTSFVNITDNSFHYNNINVGFSDLASMTSGVKTVYLTAYGLNLTGDLIQDANGNLNLSTSAEISFLCYNATDSICVLDCGYEQDPDCPQATTTITTPSTSSGGGGGGSAANSEYENTKDSFELLRGEEQEFKLELDNKYSSTKKNLKISVDGINSEYISISPTEISQINPGESKYINVKITAPAYFTRGRYLLTFSIQGILEKNNTKYDYREDKKVTLYIVEVTRESADKFIGQSEKMILEMNQSGMEMDKVTELFNQINISYSNVDFLGVKSNYEEIKEIYDSAFKSREIINELEKGIKDAENNGIKADETKKLLYLGKTIYERGDYILALKKLEEAKLTYALEVKGEFNLIYSVKNHPIQSLGILIVLGVFGFGASLVTKRQIYKRKLKLLSEEEKLLLELMKVVQREAFDKNHMSMEEYEQAMIQYEKKLGETIQDRIKYETKLANLVKVKGKKKALNEEKKRLTEMIKSLQFDYLNKGNLETRVYENMVKSYSAKLSEVEEELVFMDAQQVMKTKGIFRRMFGFLGRRKV